MITKVILRNFQRHKHLEIDFERVTVLTGKTDSGKSAVVRALRWVLTNHPKGNKFVRNGAKKCSVTLHVDGHVIKRVRGEKTNLYFLDGQKFASFKSEPPEPIQKLLMISPEAFQQQHDPVFWLSLSPSEVSRRLNEIADLHIMDVAVRMGARKRRDTQQKLKWLAEQKQAATEERKELQDVPQMIEEFRGLQELDQEITNNVERHSRLIAVSSKLENLRKKSADIETGLSALQKLAKISQSIQQRKSEIESLKRMSSLLSRYKRELQLCLKAVKTQKDTIATRSTFCEKCGQRIDSTR